MTNELKLFQRVEKWDDEHPIKVGYEWVPIEPQPCCENCQKNYMSWDCGIGKGHRAKYGDKSFYCSEWKAKK